MTTATEKLAQTELERRKEEEIKALKEKYPCRECQMKGIYPAHGKCPRCKGSGIDPDNQKEYKRELKEIETKFSVNPIG